MLADSSKYFTIMHRDRFVCVLRVWDSVKQMKLNSKHETKRHFIVVVTVVRSVISFTVGGRSLLSVVLHWTFNCHFNWLVKLVTCFTYEELQIIGMDNFEQLLEGAHFMV